jgi:hypothetical protein
MFNTARVCESHNARDALALISITLLAGVLLALNSAAGLGATIAGRDVPSPVYGVTLDDVSYATAEVNSL